MSSIEELRAALLRFRDERDWQQFHTLRNLIVSLNLEAGELLELTQWRGDEEMRLVVDRALSRLFRSPDLAPLYTTYFGAPDPGVLEFFQSVALPD